MNLKKVFVIFAVALMAISCGNNSEQSSDDQSTRRIMSYNVKVCNGMDGVIDYDRVAAVIKGVAPEIVALQELDSATNRSGGKITGEELASRLDMHFTFAPAIDFSGGKYGIGMLSKEKPISYRYFPLPGANEARTFLLAEFKDYYFASTHLSLTDEERVESVKIIFDKLKSISDKPLFVCGDFNATPESNPITLMKSKFTILNDVNDFTIPVDVPTKTIDFIFGYNNGYSYDVKNQVVIQEKMASDHLPLYVDVVINKK